MSPTTRCRGALLVIEGIDRTGKSTQCALLEEALQKQNIKTKLMKFPDRTTTIGQMINSYLKKNCDLDDHAVHLLFSANRWEASENMKKDLLNGVTLIVDRYAYSGVAYSAAKKTMDMSWCKQSDVGLPRPDAVLYLQLTADEAQQRAGFGDERYEEKEFQRNVLCNFASLSDPTYWVNVNANQPIEKVHESVLSVANKVILESRHEEIKKLWTTDIETANL